MSNTTDYTPEDRRALVKWRAKMILMETGEATAPGYTPEVLAALRHSYSTPPMDESAYDLLDALSEIERLQQQVETFKMTDGESFFKGLETVRSERHELLDSLEGAFIEHEGIDEGLPIANFEWYEEAGDPSVGMSGTAMWMLSKDQSCTQLLQMRALIKYLQQQVTRAKNEAYEEAAQIAYGYCDSEHVGEEIRRLITPLPPESSNT